jgi:hypothetical protein
MSYSLEFRCNECGKQKKCVDAEVLNGAIQGIHYIGLERGHLGWGVVRLDCGAFEEKK